MSLKSELILTPDRNENSSWRSRYRPLDDSQRRGGKFGIVYPAESKQSPGKIYAIKEQIIGDPKSVQETAYRELLILERLSRLRDEQECVNFVGLREWFKEWKNEDDNDDQQSIDDQQQQQALSFVLEFADVPLSKRSKLTLIEFKSIVFQVLFALACAQQACEFVHNDLHLDNILLQRPLISKSKTSQSQSLDSISPIKSTKRKLTSIRSKPNLIDQTQPNPITQSSPETPQKLIQPLEGDQQSSLTPPSMTFKMDKHRWKTSGEIVKIIDFGLSRAKLDDGSILYNYKNSYSELFSPGADVRKLHREIQRLRIIDWQIDEQPTTTIDFNDDKLSDLDKENISLSQCQQSEIEQQQMIAEQQKLKRDLMRRMGIGQAPSKLIHHPFFDSLKVKQSLVSEEKSQIQTDENLLQTTPTNDSPTPIKQYQSRKQSIKLSPRITRSVSKKNQISKTNQ